MSRAIGREKMPVAGFQKVRSRTTHRRAPTHKQECLCHIGLPPAAELIDPVASMSRRRIFILALVLAWGTAFVFGIVIPTADETTAGRALNDLVSLQSDPDRELDGNPLDSWGGLFQKARIVSQGREMTFWYSNGPDGKSASMGHDPDDLHRWTGLAKWTDARFHTGAWRLLLVGLTGYLLALAIHGRRAKRR